MKKGFTLIEIIVATAIFTIVMIIAVGSVLNAVDANHRAQSMNTIVNNMNLTFESMIRDLRTGKDYTVDSSCDPQCVSFKDKDGHVVVYEYKVDEGSAYIEKSSSDGALGTGKITSDEVFLDEVVFDIRGDGSNDGPERILLHLKGSAGSGKAQSDFNIQTLITSRFLDTSEL